MVCRLSRWSHRFQNDSACQAEVPRGARIAHPHSQDIPYLSALLVAPDVSSSAIRTSGAQHRKPCALVVIASTKSQFTTDLPDKRLNDSHAQTMGGSWIKSFR